MKKTICICEEQCENGVKQAGLELVEKRVMCIGIKKKQIVKKRLKMFNFIWDRV